MQKIEKAKRRLRVVLIVAIALGCSSATFGGVLTALTVQHPLLAEA